MNRFSIGTAGAVILFGLLGCMISGAAETQASEGEGGSMQRVHPIVTECSRNGYHSEGEILLSQKYVQIGLNAEEAEQWPELAEAMNAYSDEEKASAWERFSADMEEAGEFLTENHLLGTISYSDENEASVMRADSQMVSVLIDHIDFAGGVHGYYSKAGVSFDTATGKRLQLEDVIADRERLKEVLLDRIIMLYGNVLDAVHVREVLNGDQADEEKYQWVMDSQGIYFFFNPYQLGAYASGMQIVNIGYDELPGLFVQKYVSTLKESVIPVLEYMTCYQDVDRDGVSDGLLVRYEMDEYNSYQRIMIELNGTEYGFDLYTYASSVYLVSRDSGSYLYVFGRGDGDWEFLNVYDLSSGAPELRVEYLNGALAYDIRYDEFSLEDKTCYEYDESWEAFTDPYQMEMSVRMYALSTINGRQTYLIDEDGVPISRDQYYDVSYSWMNEEDGMRMYFTSLTDLTMREVHDDRSIGEAVSVPAGSRLWYIRTDNETWADLRMDDGRVVRAEITTGYPQEICGVQLEDALDGIRFAG